MTLLKLDLDTTGLTIGLCGLEAGVNKTLGGKFWQAWASVEWGRAGRGRDWCVNLLSRKRRRRAA